MEGGIDADVSLDYVEFQNSPSQNRYEAFTCGQGKTERAFSGPLEQLVLHLPGAKEFQSDGSRGNFILQLPEDLKGSSWFTKSTLIRFLHIIGEAEALKIASSVEGELSQLEEARKFHLSLYTQGQRNHSSTGAIGTGFSQGMEQMPNPEVQTASSDATKNELLRAMDLRLTALREELLTAFNRVIGATWSIKQVADLASFAQHFEAVELRNLLSQYLTLSKSRTTDSVNGQSNTPKTRNDNGKVTEGIADVGLSVSTTKACRNGLPAVSPAKIAQAERQGSTESDESSTSSDEGRSTVERSRPLIRSASPRRSASPMRRVQIGRAGSRRATALAIKSLGYFPAREKIPFNRDAGNSSGDEGSDQPTKKPENSVRRMSVQDAINLFESKQRDQKSNIQSLRSSVDMCIGTNKSVLRRWSAGMSETPAQSPAENSSEGGFPDVPSNSVVETVQNSVESKQESDFSAGSPDPIKSAEAGESLAEEKTASSVVDNSEDMVGAKAEEVHGRASASAEWNRQKEAELNQMLVKMLESKPSRYRNTTNGGVRKQETSGERRGGFYDHYKEKRDAKLRGENAGKRAEKEAQFKAMKEILDQRKAEMASKSKNVNASTKQGSPVQSQKMRRNSSPVPTKKEPSKPTTLRKASPKASPLPATRNSWPSTPSPRSIGPPLTKTNGTSSSSTMPNRRKTQLTPSRTGPSPKLERSQQQQKGTKASQTEKKRTMKGLEEKQQQAVGKSTKTKSAAALVDDSITVPAKPSFYSKMTKKSSVVPLESKPFLRKGTGIGPGVGPVVKTKTAQSDESSKNSGNLIHLQESDAGDGTEETTIQPPGDDLAQLTNDDAQLEVQANDSEICESAEHSEQPIARPDDGFTEKAEFSEEIQADEDSGISAAAWVEMDYQELPKLSDNGPAQIASPANVAPAAISSPRVRHSLSQMLQADSAEHDIIEWGNAENPPALVYQKDSPKGLKRLLKFARKSKGEANVTGWASPSVFSDGEEDAEEPKATSKRNADGLMRKTAFQAKGSGQQKTMFSEIYDGGNSSKGSMSFSGAHELLSAQSNANNFSTQVSHKLREGQSATGATSTKATRSFFSLSTFRSSKSSETKLR